MKITIFKSIMVIVIILMFFGLSIDSSSSIVTSSDDTTPPVTTCTLDPPTPDADNGWYVSIVTVTLNSTDDLSGVMKIQYCIDEGPIWTIPGNYGTFIIDIDKENLSIEYWAVDNDCNEEIHHIIIIDIDLTDPIIDFKYECEKIDLGVWLFYFNATAADEMSKMNRVEFYLNSVLQDTVIGSGPLYSWKVMFGCWLNPVFRAEAYDFAGNMAYKEIKNPSIRNINFKSRRN
jgi:hypothetical protein